jgi:hypothetical protein
MTRGPPGRPTKTTIAKLLRIDLVTVGRIVERVVTDHVEETRLAGLVMIGVDDVPVDLHRRSPQRMKQNERWPLRQLR